MRERLLCSIILFSRRCSAWMDSDPQRHGNYNNNNKTTNNYSCNSNLIGGRVGGREGGVGGRGRKKLSGQLVLKLK